MQNKQNRNVEQRGALAWCVVLAASLASVASPSAARAASGATGAMSDAVNKALSEAKADVTTGNPALAKAGTAAALKTLQNYAPSIGKTAYGDKIEDPSWTAPTLAPVPAELKLPYWNNIVAKQDDLEDTLASEEQSLIDDISKLDDKQFIERIKKMYDVTKAAADVAGATGPLGVITGLNDFVSGCKEFYDSEKQYQADKKAYKISLKKKEKILEALRVALLDVRKRRRTVREIQDVVDEIGGLLPKLQTAMNAAQALPVPPVQLQSFFAQPWLDQLLAVEAKWNAAELPYTSAVSVVGTLRSKASSTYKAISKPLQSDMTAWKEVDAAAAALLAKMQKARSDALAGLKANVAAWKATVGKLDAAAKDLGLGKAPTLPSCSPHLVTWPKAQNLQDSFPWAWTAWYGTKEPYKPLIAAEKQPNVGAATAYAERGLPYAIELLALVEDWAIAWRVGYASLPFDDFKALVAAGKGGRAYVRSILSEDGFQCVRENLKALSDEADRLDKVYGDVASALGSMGSLANQVASEAAAIGDYIAANPKTLGPGELAGVDVVAVENLAAVAPVGAGGLSVGGAAAVVAWIADTVDMVEGAEPMVADQTTIVSDRAFEAIAALEAHVKAQAEIVASKGDAATLDAFLAPGVSTQSGDTSHLGANLQRIDEAVFRWLYLGEGLDEAEISGLLAWLDSVSTSGFVAAWKAHRKASDALISASWLGQTSGTGMYDAQPDFLVLPKSTEAADALTALHWPTDKTTTFGEGPGWMTADEIAARLPKIKAILSALPKAGLQGYKLDLLAGNGQKVGYGQAPPAQLKVRVRDAASAPAEGVLLRVLITPAGGGTTVFADCSSLADGACAFDLPKLWGVGEHAGVVKIAGGGSDGPSLQVAFTVEQDLDADGAVDSWEQAFGLDSNDPSDGAADTDGDGLDNATEAAIGSSPWLKDSDEDGHDDNVELAAGTDPTDPNSKPAPGGGGGGGGTVPAGVGAVWHASTWQGPTQRFGGIGLTSGNTLLRLVYERFETADLPPGLACEPRFRGVSAGGEIGSPATMTFQSRWWSCDRTALLRSEDGSRWQRVATGPARQFVNAPGFVRDGAAYAYWTASLEPLPDAEACAAKLEACLVANRDPTTYGGCIDTIGCKTRKTVFVDGLWRSTDLLNWTRVGDATHPAIGFRKLELGGKLVAIDPVEQKVYASEDGIAWTTLTESVAFPPRANPGIGVHDGALWLIGGKELDPPPQGPYARNDVWRSTDGINWQQVTAKASFGPRSGVWVTSFGGALWAAGGAHEVPNALVPLQNQLWVSADGVDWQLRATEEPEQGGFVGGGPHAWHQRLFAGVGDRSGQGGAWHQIVRGTSYWSDPLPGATCADDADCDGILDAADACPQAFDPGAPNLDGDALPDACDPDRDGDGVENALDNCPDRPNANQAESDGGDGFGDACDVCPKAGDPSQRDSNGDGRGDACDPIGGIARIHIDVRGIPAGEHGPLRIGLWSPYESAVEDAFVDGLDFLGAQRQPGTVVQVPADVASLHVNALVYDAHVYQGLGAFLDDNDNGLLDPGEPRGIATDPIFATKGAAADTVAVTLVVPGGGGGDAGGTDVVGGGGGGPTPNKTSSDGGFFGCSAAPTGRGLPKAGWPLALLGLLSCATLVRLRRGAATAPRRS